MMMRVLLLIIATLCATCSLASAQSFLAELKAEQNPVKRAEKALLFADTAFEYAHQSYDKGDVHKGDAQLDEMTAALRECVQSLDSAHKAGMYKKAELKVSMLQRRMTGLVDNISMEERGWAEFTSRKLEEIHDKLLDGVMRK